MGLKRYTLLTGATGLLGQHLLADMLRCRIPVAVLVRSDRKATARQRIEKQLQRLERSAGRTLPRPLILEGSLTSPQLGLSSSAHAWLSVNCRSVLHSAAHLSFKPAAQHPQQEPITTNVHGTRALLEVCQAAGVEDFHYVSSAYTCGLRTGRVLETDGRQGQAFANDYENTKLTCEEMLSAAFPPEQLTVYRPSIVIDLAEGGALTGDRTIYQAFFIYRLHVAQFGPPAPGSMLSNVGLRGHEHKNIVPADWVARTIVEIFRRPEWHGRAYHLTHPAGATLRDLDQAFCEVLQAESPRPARGPVRSAESAQRSMQILADQFIETFTPYFRDDPVFDQTQLLEALSACGLSNCPAIGVAELKRFAAMQLTPAPLKDRSASASGERPDLHAAPLLVEAGPDAYGLILTGPQGGEFILDANGELSQGAAETCPVRIYLPSSLWIELQQAAVSWGSAIAEGRVLVEWDLTSLDVSRVIERLEQHAAAVSPAAGRRRNLRGVGVQGE